MPGGVPVATMGIGNAKNAGLMAARILAINNLDIKRKLEDYVKDMAQKIKDIKI